MQASCRVCWTSGAPLLGRNSQAGCVETSALVAGVAPSRSGRGSRPTAGGGCQFGNPADSVAGLKLFGRHSPSLCPFPFGVGTLRIVYLCLQRCGVDGEFGCLPAGVGAPRRPEGGRAGAGDADRIGRPARGHEGAGPAIGETRQAGCGIPEIGVGVGAPHPGGMAVVGVVRQRLGIESEYQGSDDRHLTPVGEGDHACAREMTKAHMPPRVAGNRGKVTSTTVPVHNNVRTTGRRGAGGMWMRGLCGDCNSRARLKTGRMATSPRGWTPTSGRVASCTFRVLTQRRPYGSHQAWWPDRS